MAEALENVTWVYAAGWWDGPMDGMVRTGDGRTLWAIVTDERGDDGADSTLRTYALYDMPAGWWAHEHERHALWLACCGNLSWDKPPGWVPNRPIEEFYERYPPDAPERRERIEAIGVLVGLVVEPDITISAEAC